MKSSDVARLVVALSDAATATEKREAVEYLRRACDHDCERSYVGDREFCGDCGIERGRVAGDRDHNDVSLGELAYWHDEGMRCSPVFQDRLCWAMSDEILRRRGAIK